MGLMQLKLMDTENAVILDIMNTVITAVVMQIDIGMAQLVLGTIATHQMLWE